MIGSPLIEELEELEGAEEFLDYFAIAYNPAVVQVNRLHILQRFHDYLKAADDTPEDETSLREKYARCLQQAYQDFVDSDALTERVFKILRDNQEPTKTFVPLSEAFR
jgi:nitrogenase-stabilizing/protective protein